jgi:haloalkane dehalogenase
VLASLITALDLRDVTLVCQDWGGPIGLAQAVTMPDRFTRLIIMNTWLHHPGYEYTAAIRTWIAAWRDGALFDRERPNAALVPLLSAGVAARGQLVRAIVSGREPELTGEAATMYAGFAAPFRGLTDAAFNGLRMFPLSIPVTDAHSEGAAMQTAHYEALLASPKPVHFVWGGSDDVFTDTWGRTWAGRMGATFDVIPDAHHFLQNTHGPQIADIVLRRISEEAS